MLEDKEYFKRHKYRPPDDYVVRAFVSPKIKFMESNGCFKKKDIQILDVGSGNGTFSWYFREYTDEIICLDYSEQLLRLNAARMRARADVYELPFRDGQFDLVFEANVLHHLDNPYSALKEMNRCSREYIVLVEPNRYNPLMFIFSLLCKAERGVLVSYLAKWECLVRSLRIKVIAGMVTGMISQQHTPAFLVPLLKHFDYKFILGEYIILVCRKYSS